MMFFEDTSTDKYAFVSAGVLCMDLSVEAELLLAGSDHGEVAAWSLTDQQLLHLLLGHTGHAASIEDNKSENGINTKQEVFNFLCDLCCRCSSVSHSD